ncbi:hypothetical protein QVD17_39796 [Tagetes erecta]|uniref:F-box domain-containing protein n=1 Tax=Tagetes erecta TaxID=13708 RepID=A0AAD8JT37_TARER|nr:hypothetical protein QVD17_39796 [Tagetes erecta]
MSIPFEMKTLEPDQSKKTITLPIEIIEEIISRVPVKSILRFRSVSKPWLSIISNNPSFTKLHFTRTTSNHFTALFIAAYDQCNRKRYFLSAARDGGLITHLMTLDNARTIGTSQAQHLKGLVCFSFTSLYPNCNCSYAYIINPSTRSVFKLPEPDDLLTYGKVHACYLFGFDEFTNEHKVVLYIRKHGGSVVEFRIFSMSSYSWRKIDVEPPVGFTWDSLRFDTKSSVCVNSVVHLMLRGSFDVLAIDLRTNKSCVISTPHGVVPSTPFRLDARNVTLTKDNYPRIIKIDGCVGVVCHDRVVESNEMHIWILQDYESRVWIRETIAFPKPWSKLDGPFPFDDDNMGGVIFSLRKTSGNVVNLPIYNKKRKSFKSIQFTLGELLCSKTITFGEIKCYAESILPL